MPKAAHCHPQRAWAARALGKSTGASRRTGGPQTPAGRRNRSAQASEHVRIKKTSISPKA